MAGRKRKVVGEPEKSVGDGGEPDTGNLFDGDAFDEDEERDLSRDSAFDGLSQDRRERNRWKWDQ